MPSAVILVHGLRTSATMWRQQVEHRMSGRALPGPGAHPGLDRGEGLTVEEVGRVHGVPCSAELVGEGRHPRRQSLDVVEEDDLRHRNLH